MSTTTAAASNPPAGEELVLYHCLSARSFRPLWTLEEMGLPYKLMMLPFPPRVFAKPYLAINPLGTIPTLLHGPLRMTESAGICHYLVTRFGPSPLAVPVDDPDYGTWLNWLYFSDATLTFPQTLVLRYTRLEPQERRQPQVAEDYRKWFLGRLRIVESTLGTREFLAAGRFTAADIAIGYALLLADTLKLSADFGPAVSAYYARLQQRPGYRQAMAAQEKAFTEQGIDPATRV
jgi:glutathione S-transferase